MRSNQFHFGAVTRSYWDFYFGYAMVNAFMCLIEAVLFWQLANMVRQTPRSVVPIAAIFVLFNVGHALLAARFFIRIPIVFDLMIAVLLAIAGIAATTRAMPTAGVDRVHADNSTHRL
jgi:hypothetical protein